MIVSRRFLWLAGLFVAFTLPVQAGAANGNDRMKDGMLMIGKAEVMSLQDVETQMQTSIFVGADKESIEKAVPGGKAPSSINVFLVKLNGRHILIDTGLGMADGPRKSKLPEAMAAAGVKPEQINAILITHMHGDHIGGLASEGKRAFPNATVYVCKAEYDYWMSDEAMAAQPAKKESFEMARYKLSLYKNKVKVFVPGSRLVSGFIAREAYGHTPGHVAFELESAGEKLLFWGDIVHAAALQFANPRISATYDMDTWQAVATRTGLMKSAAEENLPVAGVHLPFPGIGRVSQVSPGSFAYTPGL